MRILHFFDGRRLEKHLQVNYILGLSKYCDVFIYGENEQELNGTKISPIAYEKTKPFKEIVDTIKPDMLVLPEYAILTGNMEGYEELSKINDIPKVSIEGDAYVMKDRLNWHISMGINFVVSRAPFGKSYFGVPSVWLPFSVPDEFYLKEFTVNRLNKILFFGGGRFGANMFYGIRRKAIFLLERADMLDYFPPDSFEMYRDYLRKYKSSLSCCFGDLNMGPAKNWEIPASGCLLFTNDFIGRELIFGDKLFIEYKKDCSDVVERAEDILAHDYSELAYAAWKIIGDKHLSSLRVKELYNILNAVLNGVKVEDKWNIDYL